MNLCACTDHLSPDDPELSLKKLARCCLLFSLHLMGDMYRTSIPKPLISMDVMCSMEDIYSLVFDWFGGDDDVTICMNQQMKTQAVFIVDGEDKCRGFLDSVEDSALPFAVCRLTREMPIFLSGGLLDIISN